MSLATSVTDLLPDGSSAKSVGDWVGTISTMRPKKAKKTKENDDDGVSSPGWTCRGNPGRFTVWLQAGLLTVKSAVDSIEKAGLNRPDVRTCGATGIVTHPRIPQTKLKNRRECSRSRHGYLLARPFLP